MYNHTRHLALERLEQEAHARGANAVVDITTRIMPFGAGVREMLMVGTASHNPSSGTPDRPVTSELTGEELWNLTHMGYAPLRLVLGTSVYALGLAGGITRHVQLAVAGRGRPRSPAWCTRPGRTAWPISRSEAEASSGRRRHRHQGVRLRDQPGFGRGDGHRHRHPPESRRSARTVSSSFRKR